MLPVGFSHSSFAKIAAQPSGTTLRKRTSHVFPIAPENVLEARRTFSRFGAP